MRRYKSQTLCAPQSPTFQPTPFPALTCASHSTPTHVGQGSAAGSLHIKGSRESRHRRSSAQVTTNLPAKAQPGTLGSLGDCCCRRKQAAASSPLNVGLHSLEQPSSLCANSRTPFPSRPRRAELRHRLLGLLKPQIRRRFPRLS